MNRPRGPMLQVLLLSEDPDWGSVAMCMLESRRYAVRLAMDRDEALLALKDRGPDLILVDARLDPHAWRDVLEEPAPPPLLRQVRDDYLVEWHGESRGLTTSAPQDLSTLTQAVDEALACTRLQVLPGANEACARRSRRAG